MSKKHHYLPILYLKGFAKNKKGFFIYYKDKDEIFPSTPDNSFYEKHRNTIFLFKENEREEKMLETLYEKFETKYAYLFEKTKKHKYEPSAEALSPDEKLELAYFLSILYWRLPINDGEAKQIIKGGNTNNLGISLMSKVDGSSLKFLEEVLTKIPEAEKIFRLNLAHTLFSNPKNLRNTFFWRFSYWESGFFLTSENPFIYNKKPKREDIMNEDFIFPMSSKRLLLGSKNPPKFSGKHVVLVSMQLIYQSKMICCENKEYLEILIEKYKSLSEQLKENLKNLLFENKGFETPNIF